MADSFEELVSKKEVIYAVLRVLDKHINDSREYPTELFAIKREVLDAISHVEFYCVGLKNGGTDNA